MLVAQAKVLMPVNQSDSEELVGKRLNTLAIAFFIPVCWLMSLVGTTGSLSVLTLISRQKKLSNHNRFITNLFVANLFILGYWWPSLALDLVLGHHPVVNQYHCLVNALIITAVDEVYVASLMLISLNRYILVCRFPLYDSVFSRRRASLMMGLTWVLGIAISLAILAADPQHYGYDTYLHVCTVKASARDVVLKTSLVYVYFILPLAFIAFCNCAIYQFWTQANVNVLSTYLKNRTKSISQRVFRNTPSQRGISPSSSVDPPNHRDSIWKIGDNVARIGAGKQKLPSPSSSTSDSQSGSKFDVFEHFPSTSSHTGFHSSSGSVKFSAPPLSSKTESLLVRSQRAGERSGGHTSKNPLASRGMTSAQCQSSVSQEAQDTGEGFFHKAVSQSERRPTLTGPKLRTKVDSQSVPVVCGGVSVLTSTYRPARDRKVFSNSMPYVVPSSNFRPRDRSSLLGDRPSVSGEVQGSVTDVTNLTGLEVEEDLTRPQETEVTTSAAETTDTSVMVQPSSTDTDDVDTATSTEDLDSSVVPGASSTFLTQAKYDSDTDSMPTSSETYSLGGKLSSTEHPVDFSEMSKSIDVSTSFPDVRPQSTLHFDLSHPPTPTKSHSAPVVLPDNGVQMVSASRRHMSLLSDLLPSDFSRLRRILERTEEAEKKLLPPTRDLMSQIEKLLSPKQPLISQNEKLLSPKQPLISQNEKILSSKQPLMSQQEKILSSKQPLMSQQEKILSSKQPLMSQNEKILSSKQPLMSQQEKILSSKQPLMSQQEKILSSKQPLMSQQEKILSSKQPLISQQEKILSSKQPLMSQEENIFLPKQPLMSQQEKILSSKQPLMSQQEKILSSNQPLMSQQEKLLSPKQPLVSREDTILSSKESLVSGKENPLPNTEAPVVHTTHVPDTPRNILSPTFSAAPFQPIPRLDTHVPRAVSPLWTRAISTIEQPTLEQILPMERRRRSTMGESLRSWLRIPRGSLAAQPPEDSEITSNALLCRVRHMNSLMHRQDSVINSLLIVFLATSLSFLPFSIVSAVRFSVHTPPEVLVAFNLLLYLNHTCAWIVYGLMNPVLRDRYVDLYARLIRVCGCRNSDVKKGFSSQDFLGMSLSSKRPPGLADLPAHTSP